MFHETGREVWAAKVFIDATGDGDPAARAGCRFDIGRSGNGQTQPMSMMAIVTGVQYEQIRRFVRGTETDSNVPKQLLRAELKRAGVEPCPSFNIAS